jgi:membrane dipeptidase
MFDRSTQVIACGLTLLAMFAAPAARAAAPDDARLDRRLDRLMRQTPLIDGHNDLPARLRAGFGDQPMSANLNVGASMLKIPPRPDVPLQTDIPRLRAGRVGAQFWSVYIPVSIQGPEAVQATVEQIDLVKSLTIRYPDSLELALSAADVRRIHKAGRIASLIGIEGGHQINESMGVLRQMYALGARYMTLTHTTNTRWADSATDNPAHTGLTPFGKAIVREMNRLGMLVDLSHVSPDTMNAALDAARAPVIFSHSSARALVDHPRNVPDDVLRRVAQNGGIVMVNFHPGYDSAEFGAWLADRAAEQTRLSSPLYGLYIGQPARAKAALAAWDSAHPKPKHTIAMLADHADHIRKVAGIDHVGIGSDFDGIEDLPEGMHGVDGFPLLLKELMRRGWSDQDIRKIAGDNLLRVLAAAEGVAHSLKNEPPSAATVAALDGPAAH